MRSLRCLIIFAIATAATTTADFTDVLWSGLNVGLSAGLGADAETGIEPDVDTGVDTSVETNVESNVDNNANNEPDPSVEFAKDTANAAVDYFTVRKMDITKSDLLACSEIRSARESECYHRAKLLATLLPDVKYFREITQWLNTRCVREHAIRSTSSMFPAEARDQVDKIVLSATYTLQNTDGYDFTEQRAQLRRIQNVYVRVDNSSFLNRNTLLELQTMITESKNLSSRFDMYIQCN
ncbi:metalloprotease family [Plasmopara halstedii]|uniref:Mitochondrial inner membrane protease ATP23 n=1 Tax=Plasmopara halstedii TaxID=4781 RepID=A0A0N7L810_PLAHL|nr:metalloprotease family [Plasmopara halstedii]CEG48571.1 metalloprotease family [Plasmopara halstedii]|eukprot:XP_024584940.1 metalloprotease family [Plasmopara halstedii]